MMHGHKNIKLQRKMYFNLYYVTL